MKSELTKLFSRAAGMLLMMLLTTATAWAEEVDAMYIGADGNPYSVTATVVTNSMNTIGISLKTTWYVVNSNVTRNGEIDFLGDVHLILADGCTLTVDGKTSNYAIQGGIYSTLTIYGQSGGTGKLSTTGKRGIHSVTDLVVYGGTIEATATSSDYYAISSEHRVIIKDGTVTTTGTSSKGGILGQTGVEISGGKVTATGGTYGISTQGNHAITLGWTHATDIIKAKNYHVESGSVSITADQTLLIDDNPAQLVSGTVSNLSVIDGKKLTPDYSSDFSKDSDTEYTIHTAKGWDVFCDALQDNTTYNHFIGKTVKLDADYIEVTRMAGSPYHDFCGTFDGQKNMIFVNYGSAGEIVDENNAAPFRNVKDGCVIENLHVNGNIFTYKKYAGGLVGTQYGEVTIRNCWVSTIIYSYTPGDGTHGGIVGHAGNSSNTKLTIKGCLFDGQLTTYGMTPTTDCGGFVGYKHDAGTVSITNSLYAPFNGDYDWEVASGATFVRNGSAGANCYYTRALGTAQGKQPRTVSGGENVSVEVSPIGNATATYDVSSITAYANGIMHDDTFYYGEGDQVSLTLSHTPTANIFIGYEASAGTLDGNNNPYTLTMPDENVEISARYAPTNGTCGKTTNDNVTWAVTDTDNNGTTETLTISGTGAMAD